MHLKRSALVVVMVVVASSVGADVIVEEDAYEEDGIIVECDEGDGLEPCRDADGETFKHADDPNYIKLDSTQQLEKSSAEIRNESPKELEKTIQQIEDDEHN